jgi:hypothetical protein
MPANTTCFDYPGSASPDGMNRDAGQAVRRDLRRMPSTCYSHSKLCFSYPDGTPRGDENPGAAQPPPPGLRRMPYSTCFRY